VGFLRWRVRRHYVGTESNKGAAVKRLAMAVALLAMVAVSAPRPASADTTETLAYTFALTLGGTVAGAYALPYIVPAIAPTVQAAYSGTSMVLGTVLPTAGLDSAMSSVGSFFVTDPRMIGAITGMTAGLFTGLYLFSEEEATTDTPTESKTSNTAVKVRR
jgi:hypothetical protein